MKSTKDILNDIDDKLLLHYELNYVNNLKKEIQQYKQQIDELAKWLESEISKCLEDNVSNRAKPNVRFWRLYDLREVLSKLKERDEK